MEINGLLIGILEYFVLVCNESLGSIIIILVMFIFSIFLSDIFYSMMKDQGVSKHEINFLSVLLPTSMSLYPSMEISLILFGIQFSHLDYFLHTGLIFSLIGMINYTLASFVLSRHPDIECLDMI